MDSLSMMGMLAASGYLVYSVMEGHRKNSIPQHPTLKTGHSRAVVRSYKSNLIQPAETATQVAGVRPLQPVRPGCAIRWELTLKDNTRVYVTASPQRLAQRFQVAPAMLACCAEPMET
jgi:hypothetical protein